MTWNVWRARTHPEEVKAESLHRIAECLETLIELEKRQADSLDRIGMLLLQGLKGHPVAWNNVIEAEIDATSIVRREMGKQINEYFGDSEAH